jgi:hypothetical protein
MTGTITNGTHPSHALDPLFFTLLKTHANQAPRAGLRRLSAFALPSPYRGLTYDQSVTCITACGRLHICGFHPLRIHGGTKPLC